MMPKLATINQALEALRQGKPVIVVDDEQRENEGDLVVSAEKVTPESLNFLAQYGRGLVCMPMLPEAFERLGIDMMTHKNQSTFHTAFGVSIGAANDITTGISAADRALTVQVAANPDSTAADIVKPGHVFPLKAKPNGVVERAGHTEASVDLMRLAGLQPAAVICEVMNSDGTMARLPQLGRFAKKHDLLIVSIEQLIHYRYCNENFIEEVATTKLPVESGEVWQMKVFRSTIDQQEISVLLPQKPVAAKEPLVRLHSQCLTGDVFGSNRCDCGWQLKQSMQMLSQQGGVLLYLPQEGRGIGLANKIKAYALQDQGMDTVEANHALGFAADERNYALAAQVLRELGLDKVTLLTNNPQKHAQLERYGVVVKRCEPLVAPSNEHNAQYLQTKKDKLGHRFDNEGEDNVRKLSDCI
ncbi:MAG: 3,4-dihydroxy-2-butanone-4-phosphate synthase [Coxiellaceae bacterium]|nr:3,4-dihydroxy-2-butanone-4-phosphate synthase [Coxiellaceae bacterium]